ncbi:secondary thiamine-phosphate synthase enzyme YjbQ [Egibacter rhizosphaerae]|nr:secondary thiamine-phosphate synthase enzyme YjbQ [Egibacter rhizosphaerae]
MNGNGSAPSAPSQAGAFADGSPATVPSAAAEATSLAGRTPVLARQVLELTTAHSFHVVDVTDQCVELIRASQMQEGTLTVFSPHTTCAVKINEREDCFLEDLRHFMEGLIPRDAYYRHDDFSVRDPATVATTVEEEPINGHAHIKQMLLGSSSEHVPIVAGALALGRWQRIMFIELDQSRPRRIQLTAQGWG